MYTLRLINEFWWVFPLLHFLNQEEGILEFDIFGAFTTIYQYWTEIINIVAKMSILIFYFVLI